MAYRIFPVSACLSAIVSQSTPSSPPPPPPPPVCARLAASLPPVFSFDNRGFLPIRVPQCVRVLSQVSNVRANAITA